MEERSRERHGLSAATGGVVLVALGLFAAWLAIAVSRNSPVDFYVYYMAGWLARSGHSFYLISRTAWNETAGQLDVTHFSWPYRYPPYTAALASLLTPLGAFRAMVTWVVADTLALLLGTIVLGSALGGGWRTRVAIVALALFGPTYQTIFDGQVNGLTFVGLAVGFWGLARGRALPAGVGVAVAAALKLTPVVLLAYLAWRRRWRALAVAGVTLVLLTAATLPLVGAGAYVQYARQAYQLTDPQHVNPSGANQTSTAVLARLVLPSPGKVDATIAGAGIVRASALAFAVALVLATALVTRSRRERPLATGHRPERAPRRCTGIGHRAGPDAATPGDLIGFGAVIAATLVIGPFTWYHQFVWLLIPIVALICRALSLRRWPSLAALAVLIVCTDLNELLWTRLHDGVIHSGVYRGLSLPFVTALVVWGMSAVLIQRRAGAMQVSSTSHSSEGASDAARSQVRRLAGP